MGKKKSKKKKKQLFKHYKLFLFVGALFHFITYIFYEKTFYNSTFFWGSAGVCGLLFALYFIRKTDLLNPKSYKKLDGAKLFLYMLFLCILMTVGGIIIFGNVINGTVLALNSIGKGNESKTVTYRIEKIEHNRTTGGRRGMPKNNPELFLIKDGQLISITLPERWDANKKYADYTAIEFELVKGLFGFEVIEEYELKK